MKGSKEWISDAFNWRWFQGILENRTWEFDQSAMVLIALLSNSMSSWNSICPVMNASRVFMAFALCTVTLSRWNRVKPFSSSSLCLQNFYFSISWLQIWACLWKNNHIVFQFFHFFIRVFIYFIFSEVKRFCRFLCAHPCVIQRFMYLFVCSRI